MDGEAPTCTDPAGEEGTAADESKAKDLKRTHTDIVYPSGLKLALLITSIFVAMFLVSLDRLIISTAIPQITNDFDSAGDIGWYGTAYLLSNCSFQLLFGKLYTLFSIKVIFLTAILLFEACSALFGAAPNSIAFILGRAIAGIGSGGILSGVIVVIVYAVPLHKRPMYQGFFGAVFGISSVADPLIGGAFTTNVTWRWCFYLNLPLGGVVMVFIFFLLQIPDRPSIKMSFKEKLRQLDALDLLTLLPRVVCLCLALQWGGITYTASKANRMFVYYFPIWFQAVDGVSAIDSGTRLLAMVITIVVASIVTGQLVSRVGYYTPFMIFGVCLTAVGAGLLTTLEINTSEGKWIGFQIVYGFGLGSCNQAPNMAAQTVLPREDVAIGASLMFFGQQLFGAVFTSVGQNLLDNHLASRLAGIPGVSPRLIQSTGATELLNLIPAEYHAAALEAYNDSLRVCFQVGLIMACLSILGALGMEWRSVKKNIPAKNPDGERAAEEGKGQGDLSEKEAPEAQAEAEAEAVAVAAADGEKEQDRDAAAAVLTVSTEATRTAPQIGVAHTSMLATVEKTEERTETEKAEAKEMAA